MIKVIMYGIVIIVAFLFWYGIYVFLCLFFSPEIATVAVILLTVLERIYENRDLPFPIGNSK